MKKRLGLLAPLMLLLTACATTTATPTAPVSSTAQDIHFANAKGSKFTMTLLESENQKKQFPALQDQLGGKVFVDLPLYPGSTEDKGPWKGSMTIIHNLFGKTNQTRYDAPIPLALAKEWFHKEMLSEGYTTFGGGPDFTMWQYGKDQSLYVVINLLDEGNGKTLVEYGVTYDPVPKRPSNSLLSASVTQAEIKLTDGQNEKGHTTIANPDDLKKIVDLYNQLPLSGDDGNHSRPALRNPIYIEIQFTQSDGQKVEVSETPYLQVQSGTYFFFDQQEKFGQLVKGLVQGK